MKPRKPLPPELMLPIRRPDESVSESNRRSYLIGEWVKRFQLLRKHYGIKESEPDAEKNAQLLLELARDYIPGFQLEDAKRRGGRPREQAIRLSKRARQATRREKLYGSIFLAHLVGEGILKERNVRVTKSAAIREGLKAFPSLFVPPRSKPLESLQIRDMATAWAKRLPEAERFVQKSAKT